MVEVSVLWCCCIDCYYCAGVNRCKMCRGWCCSLVNDVINILVEYGEIDPDAEVNVSVSLCVVVVVFHFRVTEKPSWNSV